MNELHDMAERIAEVEELDRLRVEVRKLRDENEALSAMLAFETHSRQQRMWMEAQRAMTQAEQTRYAGMSFGPPSWLLGAVSGARWP